MEIVPHSKDPFAPVAYLRFPRLSLAEKVFKFELFLCSNGIAVVNN